VEQPDLEFQRKHADESCRHLWNTVRVDKRRLLERLDAGWRDFQASYDGLPEAELMRPGVEGEWSVRDLIAHVAIWDGEALKHLPAILQGRRPPRYSVTHGGIDAFNAAAMALTAGSSLAEVLAHAEETHRALVAFVDAVPEEHLRSETRFRRRLRLDTYGHYTLHSRAIRAWRNPGATPDGGEARP
jgi:hypothetical protein